MKTLYINLSKIGILSLFFFSVFVEAGETRPLFNGKNLDGWVIESNGQFSVEGGVIKLNRGVGWLRSADTFSDFKLTMEFRFLEKDSNSGIFVRTKATNHADDNGWPDNGYQIQCKDALIDKFPLASLIPYGGGDFETVSAPDLLEKAYKPAGEWHVYEITCRGGTVSVKLNDVLITLAIGIQNADGHIGIQGEHGLLEFRKIEIETL